MTDPLVPADVDLRGYEFMPLYGDRLFKSETWISASAEAKVAALRLWWHAYAHEVPASSLPDNDVMLAEYAGYGVALRAWQKIKPHVMHNFVLCSDGRLYHEHLAVWALEAWERRVKDRQRKANWRAAKGRGQDGDKAQDGTGTDGVTSTGQPMGHRRDVPAEAKVSEVKRSEAIFKTASVVTPTGSARGNGPKHVKVALENIAQVNGQKWDDRAYVTASAQTVGIELRTGESWEAFRDRVYEAVQGKIRSAKSAIRPRA